MERKIEIKKKNLLVKENIIFIITLLQPIDKELKDNNEPINKIIDKLDYNKIIKIQSFNDKNFMKFIYFNRHSIHRILYESDECIVVNEQNLDNYESLFYISLLINDNKSMINYIFSFETIKKVKEKQKNTYKKIKKVLIAKIIIDLIENYKEIDNYEDIDNYISEANKCKNDNLKIIDMYIDSLKEYNLNKKDILSKNIDEIYAIIIITLINNKNLDESEKTNNIIEQLNLREINITKGIIDEINKVLNKEDNIKEYMISNYDDFSNHKKITFYYVLLKDIFKLDFYIYKIPFLMETKKNISKVIKSNLDKFSSIFFQNKELRNKLEYIFNFFSINYNYHINESLKIINANKNKNISNIISTAQNENPTNINTKNDKNNIKNINNINNINNDVYYISNSNDKNFSIISFSNNEYFGNTFQKEKEKSGRSFEGFEDESIKSEKEKKFEIYSNDSCFQIFNGTFFEFSVINKNNKKDFIYTQITNKNNKKYFIDNIKNMTSKNPIVKTNFKKFVDILNQIENKYKDNLEKYNFKGKIQFVIEDFMNKIFNISCYYYIKIENEDETKYKDENILENGLKEGIYYSINDINLN